MKFAAVLRNSSEELPDTVELFRLYKQLKKSLKRIPVANADPAGMSPSSSVGGGSGQQGTDADGEVASERGDGEETVGPSGGDGSDGSGRDGVHGDSDASDSADGTGGRGGATGGATAPLPAEAVATLLGGAPPAAARGGAVDPEAQAMEEAAFVRTLTEDVARLNDAYMEREEVNVIRLEALAERVRRASTAGERRREYAAAVDLHGELLLSLHWSILAYTGLVKILKKHHKRTGLLLRAPHLADMLSQPFCSVEVTRDMVLRTEALVTSLASQLGLRVPDALSAAGEVEHAVRSAPEEDDGRPSPGRAPGGGGGDSGRARPATGPGPRGDESAGRAASGAAAGPPPTPSAAPPAARKRTRAEVAGDAGAGTGTAREARAGAGQVGGPETGVVAGPPGGPGGVAASKALPCPALGKSGEEAPDAAAAAHRDSDGSDGSDAEVGALQALSTSSVLRRTRAALGIWRQLQRTAVTPSTIAPPGAYQSGVLRMPQERAASGLTDGSVA